MAAQTRDIVIEGDSYPKRFACMQNDPDVPDGPQIPYEVVSGVARLIDTQAGDFIDLGGPGVETAALTVIAPNTVEFAVDPQFTIPSDYELHLTVTFLDGHVQTEVCRFKVKARLLV